MRRSLPVLVALLAVAGLSATAHAGQQERPAPLGQRASALGSRIVGIVTDQAGRGIGGVTVLALGTTLALARSEANGAFSLAVPAGEYVLRAARDGYVSTFREAVRVQGDLPLERRITLLEAGVDAAGRLVLASVGGLEAQPDPSTVTDSERPGRTPSETAWRLRHLPRTVLRDQAMSWSGADDPARASRFSAADLNGHVDFLTTSSMAASGASVPLDWPRGVAYVVLGAPVGNVGDWIVRAALASGAESAWTLVGEYRARADQRHAFRSGVSYSAQTILPQTGDLNLTSDVRRVGGVYAADQWRMGHGLSIGYGGRLDRYDYLADPNLFSGTFDARQTIGWRTAVRLSTSRQLVAPGADQFQPPATAGVWLPPERTFAPLDTAYSLRPERVDRHELGIDAVLRAAARTDDERLVLRVTRFSESTLDQIATLFGLDEASQVAHYYIGSPGSVQVNGWAMGVSGQFAPNLRGTVDYAVTHADWTSGRERHVLRRAARSVTRRQHDHGHDLTSSIEAVVPRTDTRVNVALRINSSFSRASALEPGLGGRFAVEIQQKLPVQIIRGSSVNLMIAARTLLSDVDTRGSYYDDLLTLSPPLRLTCGIQMRF
jgi:hypothetical protein